MNLALFDFDGTITFGDTLTPFVKLAAPRSRQVPGYAVLGPMVVGYRLNVVSPSMLRSAAVRLVFGGRPGGEVARLGATYAANALPQVVRPEARERLDWHKAHGDHIVVVSASLSAYLRPWCEAQGLDCICSELEDVQGVLTGRFKQECAGAAKATMIRARYPLDRYDVIYAYGDTEEDRDMMALATRRFYRWTAEASASSVPDGTGS